MPSLSPSTCGCAEPARDWVRNASGLQNVNSRARAQSPRPGRSWPELGSRTRVRRRPCKRLGRARPLLHPLRHLLPLRQHRRRRQVRQRTHSLRLSWRLRELAGPRGIGPCCHLDPARMQEISRRSCTSRTNDALGRDRRGKRTRSRPFGSATGVGSTTVDQIEARHGKNQSGEHDQLDLVERTMKEIAARRDIDLALWARLDRLRTEIRQASIAIVREGARTFRPLCATPSRARGPDSGRRAERRSHSGRSPKATRGAAGL